MRRMRLAVATIESCPFDQVPEEGPCLTAEAYGLPQEWQDVLWMLLREDDSARCANCGDPVGYVLHGDDSWARWVSTSLASEDDGPVVALCPQCTPFVPRGTATK